MAELRQPVNSEDMFVDRVYYCDVPCVVSSCEPYEFLSGKMPITVSRSTMICVLNDWIIAAG